jgi:hypothetical protein
VVEIVSSKQVKSELLLTLSYEGVVQHEDDRLHRTNITDFLDLDGIGIGRFLIGEFDILQQQVTIRDFLDGEQLKSIVQVKTDLS